MKSTDEVIVLLLHYTVGIKNWHEQLIGVDVAAVEVMGNALTDSIKDDAIGKDVAHETSINN